MQSMLYCPFESELTKLIQEYSDSDRPGWKQWSHLSQVLQTIKTKNTKGLSLATYILMMVANTLWTMAMLRNAPAHIRQLKKM